MYYFVDNIIDILITIAICIHEVCCKDYRRMGARALAPVIYFCTICSERHLAWSAARDRHFQFHV